MAVEMTLQAVRGAVERYCDANYPEAALAFLCGSHARRTARDDSDVDLVILDPGTESVLFQGVWNARALGRALQVTQPGG